MKLIPKDEKNGAVKILMAHAQHMHLHGGPQENNRLLTHNNQNTHTHNPQNLK